MQENPHKFWMQVAHHFFTPNLRHSCARTQGESVRRLRVAATSLSMHTRDTRTSHKHDADLNPCAKPTIAKKQNKTGASKYLLDGRGADSLEGWHGKSQEEGDTRRREMNRLITSYLLFRQEVVIRCRSNRIMHGINESLSLTSSLDASGIGR
jgi:hypothetical protein